MSRIVKRTFSGLGEDAGCQTTLFCCSWGDKTTSSIEPGSSSFSALRRETEEGQGRVPAFSFTGVEAKAFFGAIKKRVKTTIKPGTESGAAALSDIDRAIWGVFRRDHSIVAVNPTRMGASSDSSSGEEGGNLGLERRLLCL